jgi:hypothetical protein
MLALNLSDFILSLLQNIQVSNVLGLDLFAFYIKNTATALTLKTVAVKSRCSSGHTLLGILYAYQTMAEKEDTTANMTKFFTQLNFW